MKISEVQVAWYIFKMMSPLVLPPPMTAMSPLFLPRPALGAVQKVHNKCREIKPKKMDWGLLHKKLRRLQKSQN